MTPIESVWAKKLEELAGLARGRLVISIALDVMPEKSLIMIVGEPPLTNAENDLVLEAARRINAAVGGRPLIRPGSA